MEKVQRYTLKKTTVGLVSALVLGATFMTGSAYSVQAEDNGSDEEVTAVTTSLDREDVEIEDTRLNLDWRANTIEEIEKEISMQLGNQPETQMYEIQWGDTVWGITNAHKLDQDEFVRVNNIENPDLIYAGDLVTLDLTKEVVMKAGKDAGKSDVVVSDKVAVHENTSKSTQKVNKAVEQTDDKSDVVTSKQESDTQTPEVETPDKEEPEIEAPEVETPDKEDSEIETPEVETPDKEDSEIETPEVETPDKEEPEIETPEVETPDKEEPEIEAPEVETPDKEEPEIEAPEVESPDKEEPEIEAPDTGKYNFDNLDQSKVNAEIVRLLNVERTVYDMDHLTLAPRLQKGVDIRVKENHASGHFSFTRPNGESYTTAYEYAYDNPLEYVSEMTSSIDVSGVEDMVSVSNISYEVAIANIIVDEYKYSEFYYSFITDDMFNGVAIAMIGSGYNISNVIGLTAE